ncbi:hypothetical protein ASG25_04930 [Rhizobium sp. Leaf384]|uniref:hypothetical protein n=1 Tax=unclassified Rhizobium TaxID=2613769 RepID=UPI00071258CA|nr:MULTISPECIES: hypothetical protein [unclassified Rhizobium]KQS80874.1 hypothetical protein ASG25_04930 [Rhizobium sp. Leaf384]KQS86734.1 hypothetical protein ASG58_00230 [Rhizobium sp. Leaf383]
MAIDICVVAGRRPDLLEATLRDFQDRCFRFLDISACFVNIDPIFGDADDARACVSIVDRLFPGAIVFQPEKANFCSAVKRLWSSTSADHVFHLEDDWRTLTPLDQSILAPFADQSVQQVSLHTINQNWDIRRKGHLYEKRSFKLWGVKLPSFRRRPLFSTSPSVLRGDFARLAAGLLDPAYDPEKQFYSNTNMVLQTRVAPYRTYIFSPNRTPVIEDTGRLWRDERRITKAFANGQSIWTRDDESAI